MLQLSARTLEPSNLNLKPKANPKPKPNFIILPYFLLMQLENSVTLYSLLAWQEVGTVGCIALGLVEVWVGVNDVDSKALARRVEIYI